jgi:hypothetical protein
MFKKIVTAALMVVFVLGVSTAMAQSPKTFVVLPVKYDGPKSYEYLIKGIELQLKKKATWPGQYVPADVNAAGVELPSGEAQALRIADRLGTDAVIWCSIDQEGTKSDVFIQAVAKNGHQWKNQTKMDINEIPVWLERSAESIQGEVYQRPGMGQQKEAIAQLSRDNTERAAPKNQSIIAASSEGVSQPQVMSLNPNFRYEGGAQTPGRWRSQTLRFPSYGMVVGDADGDGNNEVFILSEHNLFAYRYRQGKLEPLDKTEIHSNKNNPLRLSIIDLDRDGASEIIVSARSHERPRSTIYSFKGAKFTVLKDGIRYYLSTMNLPPTFQPALVAQKNGKRGPFPRKIYEAYFNGDDVVLTSTIPRPKYGNVFNMNYLPDEGTYKVMVIDNMQRMRVFSPDMEQQYQSEETYNSSVVGIEVSDTLYGMGDVGDDNEIKDLLVIPFRMVPAAISNPKKYEMLVNKDITMAGQVFDRFNTYSQGEVHALFWDGVGLNLAWKTRRIKGTVTDLGHQDIDNDGEKELCVLLNKQTGALDFSQRKSMVLAYELNK